MCDYNRLTISHYLFNRATFLRTIPSPIFELILTFVQRDNEALQNVGHDGRLAPTYIVSTDAVLAETQETTK